MASLARKVEEAHCQANLDYYAKKVLGRPNPRQEALVLTCKEVSLDAFKPKAVDFEMKVICLGKNRPQAYTNHCN